MVADDRVRKSTSENTTDRLENDKISNSRSNRLTIEKELERCVASKNMGCSAEDSVSMPRAHRASPQHPEPQL